MIKSIKKFTILIVMLGIFVLPSFASAISPEELRAQIEALLKQIEVLKAQLAQMEGQPAVWCYNFNVNLKIEMSGSSVKALQTALEKQGFAINEDETRNNSFDESTASAVSGFQEKYKNEILTPLGLKYATGFVGKLTRAKLNSLYGCKLEPPFPCPIKVPPFCESGEEIVCPPGVDERGCSLPCKCVPTANQPPVISGISGPTSIKVNETGIWTVKASDPKQGVLTYSVLWGDEITGRGATTAPRSTSYIQTATFTHSYSKSGIYNPTFTVTNNQGLSVKTSISVKVSKIVQPSITVLSPNGLQTLQEGSNYMIRWDAFNLPADAKIHITLFRTIDDANIELVSGLPSTQREYLWKVTTRGDWAMGYEYKPSLFAKILGIKEVKAAGDGYKIMVSATWGTWGTSYYGNVWDESDNWFSIEATASCTDTDGGGNYSVKGVVTLYNETKVDYCKDRNTLGEYWCSGMGGVTWIAGPEEYTCPNGCKDGACILSTKPSITVLSPNGGEHIKLYELFDIVWDSFGVNNAYIYLWFPDGGTCKIADVSASQRKYSEVIMTNEQCPNIPQTITPGQYKILITTEIEGVSDISDDYFTIMQAGVNQPPVISGISGPTNIKVNETGIWTVKASDPEQGILSYSVLWGDEIAGRGMTTAPRSTAYVQTTTFTHSYSNPGIYNPTFTVTDNQGLSAKTSISVKVSEIVQPPIPFVAVILDTDTPLRQTIFAGTSNFIFTKIRLSAPSTEDIVINKIIITRTRLSFDSSLQNLKLFDGPTQIGSTVISLINGKVIFDGLNLIIPKNSSKVISIKADINATAVSGQEIILEINTASDISAVGNTTGITCSIIGSFPVRGNIISIISIGQSTQPSITSVFPTSGTSNDMITIYGKNLVDTIRLRELRLSF